MRARTHACAREYKGPRVRLSACLADRLPVCSLVRPCFQRSALSVRRVRAPCLVEFTRPSGCIRRSVDRVRRVGRSVCSSVGLSLRSSVHPTARPFVCPFHPSVSRLVGLGRTVDRPSVPSRPAPSVSAHPSARSPVNPPTCPSVRPPSIRSSVHPSFLLSVRYRLAEEAWTDGQP